MSEGKKSESSVGNVREILRLALGILANLPAHETATLLMRYKSKKLIKVA